jgi:hypothetical protein
MSLETTFLVFEYNDIGGAKDEIVEWCDVVMGNLAVKDRQLFFLFARLTVSSM